MILHGDCREVLATLEPNSIDACVTDPPYELGFMGKSWDSSGVAFDVETWRQVLRVLKPGGHLLAFGGTRTYHRMAVAIEDAGFEIRDQIQWLYGSGFPKSLDVSKAIDKARTEDKAPALAVSAWLRAQRESAGLSVKQVCGLVGAHGAVNNGGAVSNWESGTVPPWDWWLQLKRVIGFGDEMDAEVWRLNGRKGTPGEAWDKRELVGTVDGSRLAVAPGQKNDRSALTLDITAPATDAARRWEGWGTALKPANEPICLARKPLQGTVAANVLAHGTGALNIDGSRISAPEITETVVSDRAGARYSGILNGGRTSKPEPRVTSATPAGRWPANVILDEEAARVLDAQTGELGNAYRPNRDHEKPVKGTDGSRAYGKGIGVQLGVTYPDTGGASRFFYIAKPSKRDRGEDNNHATVKPLDLLIYLVRMITPPGGTVLDPFAGSGTTLLACQELGHKFVGVELEADHLGIIDRRLAQGTLWG